MPTLQQYAQLANRVYMRTDENRVPVPVGWNEIDYIGNDRITGFSAGAYRNGTNPGDDIVIAFTGTNEWKFLDFADANFLAGAGLPSSQVVEAMAMYLRIRQQNPTAHITFTGHSLGGGLASLMAVFFGEHATVFDQAPFQPTAFSPPTLLLFRTALQALGYASPAFDLYVANFAGEFAAREANVTAYFVEGEILDRFRTEPTTIQGVEMPALPIGPQTYLEGVSLPTLLARQSQVHSMTLLTGMVVSEAFKAMVPATRTALEMFFDKSLYSTDAETSTRVNFLDRLLNAQLGNQAPGIAPIALLDFFAEDVTRLQLNAGGTTGLLEMQKGLIAAIMEYYYYVDPARVRPFVQTGSDRIVMDLRLIDADSDDDSNENGQRRLRDSLRQFVADEDRSRAATLANLAPIWTVQAGTNPLITSGSAENEVQIGGMNHANDMHGGDGNDLLIDGSGNSTLDGGIGDDMLVGGGGGDTLYGGSGTDYLTGGDGNDVLIGGSGLDSLYGGVGSDDYNFFSDDDGFNFVRDSDGLGTINVDGAPVTIGQRIGENRWRSGDGLLVIERQPLAVDAGPGLANLVIRDPEGSLVINVQYWHDGDLGLTLNFGSYPAAGQTGGDIVAPATGPTNWPPVAVINGSGNSTSYLDFDNLVGSLSADRIFGLAGNDILIGRGGDDYLDGGDARDLLIGGTGRDQLIGGDAGDVLIGDRDDITLSYQIGGSPGQVYVPATGGDVFHGLGWGVELVGSAGPISDYLLNGVSSGYFGGDADFIDAGAGDDYVAAGDGDDVISGGSGADQVIGEAGNDTVQGGAGNDIIIGDGQRNDGDPNILVIYSDITAQGQDVLSGGDDNDFLAGGGNADQLYGDDGDDQLWGDAVTGFDVAMADRGNDLLDGGAGDDFLTGDAGNDMLFGGDGADTLRGDADDLAAEFHGDDLLSGGAGNDALEGGGGWDDLFGGDGNDLMFGDSDADLDAGYQGVDYLDGGAGDDIMSGGGNIDRLFGGIGNDHLYGDYGNVGMTAGQADDYLDGGVGNDQIVGGGGNDTIIGGDGADVIEGDAAAALTPFAMHGNDVIDAGDGNDTVYGWGGADTISGGDGADQLVGDEFTLPTQYHGNDDIYGGLGNDTLWGLGGDDRLWGGLDDDILDGDDGSNPSVVGNDMLDGGAGNDNLYGRAGNDVLIGDAGDDSLSGGDGDDELSGGDGDDALFGGAGNDTLYGGTGNDWLEGGAGDDVYVFDQEDLRVINGTTDAISDLDGNNSIVFRTGLSTSNITLSQGAIFGTIDIVQTGEDIGLILENALSGAVRSFTFSDGTLLSASALIGHHYVGLANQSSSNVGAYLLGGVFDDTIAATGNNATLSGGFGNDTLTGGSGSTTYLFEQGDGLDTINDTSSYAASGGTNRNRVEFGQGISLSSLTLSYRLSDGSLTLLTGSGSGLNLTSFDAQNVLSGARTIDEIQLHDGTVRTWEQLVADRGITIVNTSSLASYVGTNVEDRITGAALDETIDAGSGNDIIEALAGNDTLTGGAGSDVYRFGRGHGRDTILNYDSAVEALDAIELAADIAPTDVKFIRLAADLVIAISGTQDRITVRDYFAAGAVDEIRFVNGTVYTPANVPAITSNLNATTGADLLVGTSGDDTIDALAGNDEVYGGQGNDSIIGGSGVDSLYGGDGNDTITDSDGQANVIFGDAGADTITADGTLDGGDGDDILTGGGAGNVVMRGGAGSDTLHVSNFRWHVTDGGTGNDTYYIHQAFQASVTIDQNDLTAGKIDTVRFGSGITPASITFSFTAAGDLVLSWNSSSQLTIVGFLLEDTNGRKIDQFVFDADAGTVWTPAFIESLLGAPSAGNNYIRGTSGADVINALAGNDVIHGGAGNDTLSGGGTVLGGSDVLYGDDGDDTLLDGTRSYGGAGNDQIIGTHELYGGSGDDVLQGLQPAEHGNSYEGGAGSDTYVIIRNLATRTQFDTIGDIDLDSNYLDTNPSSIDAIKFAAGIGSSDIRVQRLGNNLQVEIYSRWGQRERVVDVQGFFTPGNETAVLDEIRFTDEPAVVWARADILALVGQGGDARDDMVGSNGADTLYGNAGNDRLQGTGGDDSLNGGSGEDVLEGGDGNDHLSGGAGNDYIEGGAGDDTFHFGHGQGHDEIVDSAIATAANTIAFDAGISLADVTFYRTSGMGHLGPWGNQGGGDLVIALNGSSEQLRIQGFYAPGPTSSSYRFAFADGTVLWYDDDRGAGITVAELEVNLSGTASAQFGTAGDDTFIVDHPNDTAEGGGGGVDTIQAAISYVLANGSGVENLTLTGLFDNIATGNELDNVIRGNVADNVLSGGGQGADTLIGGQGNDTYTVDGDDTVIEGAGEGYDTVIVNSDGVVLAANVERAILGTIGFSAQPTHITGNSLNNIIDASASSLPGNEWLSNLIIDGGAGADEMIGGVSGQTFVIDDAGDVIRFSAVGNPLGNVESYISYTALDFIRNITLRGSQSIAATGNALNNTLDGSQNSAANVLSGGAGDDTYILGAGDTINESAGGGIDTVKSANSIVLQNELENLVLLGAAAVNGTGNAANNQLTGNSAVNTLDGGAGADAMTGGGGNDIYIVDDAGDSVTEASNGGTDEVRASISYTLGNNVENLTLTGTAAINATGNSAVNTLVGNSGNNTLDGGAGSDIMRGGLGNDVYFVSVANETVTEVAGEGIDEIRSGVTITMLAAEVENLTLTGTSGIGGTGNILDNVITGNSGNNSLSGGNGNDTLIGGAGDDSMSGGAGNDTFYVDATNDGTTETSGQGIDTVISSVTRTLSSNIELLFLSGPDPIAGNGNNASNLLRGNAAANALNGMLGIDILEGGAGNDTLTNATNKSLLNGGADTDTLTGTAANDMLIGGTGNDALTTGAGADIIVFNKGDGQDTVAASTTRDNTLSIGSAVYADLLFQKSGNDLVLKVGASDQITLVGYYTSASNRSVNNLQVVIEGTSEYDAGSASAIRNKKIETFNFEGLFTAFEAARAATPGLTTWALSNALLAQHLSGSDTAAIGGDLAYRYNRLGTLSDISFTPALGILGASGFGTTAQTLQSLASLQDSSARLS